MKALLVASVLGTLLHVASAFAASPTASPLVGHWVLDVSTLPMPAAVRPKQVTLEFSAAADGKWNTQVEIVDQQDKRMHSASSLPLDGTPGVPTGDYWVDLIAAKMPEPNVLVMQFVYQKIPRSTRVYSVNADGSVLTETETYFKEDGTPMMRTAHFTRAEKQ